MKVVIRGARLAFVNIWEPRSFAGGGDARCSSSFILDPKAQNAEVAKIIEQQVRAICVLLESQPVEAGSGREGE